MEEPYFLTLDQIGKLTDAQIIGIYGRERDDKGRPKKIGPDRRRKFATPEEAYTAFLNILAAFGKSEDEARTAWEKSRTKGL